MFRRICLCHVCLADGAGELESTPAASGAENLDYGVSAQLREQPPRHHHVCLPRRDLLRGGVWPALWDRREVGALGGLLAFSPPSVTNAFSLALLCTRSPRRCDYLEFTDSRGGKVRYDMKVGTDKWPKVRRQELYILSTFKNTVFSSLTRPALQSTSSSSLAQKVTFDAGPQLQFLFHSDSSNNEWGYKFTVTALGLPDITISWMSDLQLLVARLMGRLASRTLALKSPYGETFVLSTFGQRKWVLDCKFRVWVDLINPREGFLFLSFVLLLSVVEIRSVKELPPGKMSHVQSSPLWKPILRHGLTETRESTVTKTEQVCFHHWHALLIPHVTFTHFDTLSHSLQTNNWSLDELARFLEDYARWNPSQEPTDGRTELMKTMMHSCRKHTVRHEITAGPKTDQAVNAIWAAMVYHTPALTNALMTYG